MRLKNNAPICSLNDIGLSQPIFGAAKNLLSVGEKLKDAEQSLIFLNKCKSNNIFPPFIINRTKDLADVFPLGMNSFSNYHVYKLRLQSLNQNIIMKRHSIYNHKMDIQSMKTSAETHHTIRIIKLRG